MNILSIQSHVSFGHVGNSAAVFPMQRLGCEVWPIHTVQFSNHTGYGHWTGRVFDGPLIEDLVDGIAARGALTRCDGILSGYMGSADVGNAILAAAGRVRAANPHALWCCDPVIGDVGRGVFVRPGIPEFMREKAVPAADIVTPNSFELEYLTERTCGTLDGLRAAVDILHVLGPRTILVTSVHTEETPLDAVDLVVSEGGALFRVRTPKLALEINGAGDAIAALFFVHRLRSGDAAQALSMAASSIHGLLRRTEAAGSREILLVEAQEEFVSPSHVFLPESL